LKRFAGWLLLSIYHWLRCGFYRAFVAVIGLDDLVDVPVCVENLVAFVKVHVNESGLFLFFFRMRLLYFKRLFLYSFLLASFRNCLGGILLLIDLALWLLSILLLNTKR
jgi:hypothetical protein